MIRTSDRGDHPATVRARSWLTQEWFRSVRRFAVDNPAANRPDLVVSLDTGRLAVACAARGWSYKELARRSRLSRPTVTAARRGLAVGPRTAYKILRALEEVPAAAQASELFRDR